MGRSDSPSEPPPAFRAHIHVADSHQVRVVFSNWENGGWAKTGLWVDRASLEDLAEELLFGREP